MRIQTSVDNTVNDLRYEITFAKKMPRIKFLGILKNVSKNKIYFFKQKYILFLETLFKIPKNLILGIFFCRGR